MIEILTNADPGFYPTLGPYLARRDVVEFVGSTVWDDDSKTWFVARTNDGVQGFCGVCPYTRLRRLAVESLYLTDADDRATATRLIAAAVGHFGDDADLQATVRHDNAYAYLAAGFIAGTRTAKLTTLLRPATRTGKR